MEIGIHVPCVTKPSGAHGYNFDGIWKSTDEVQWALWGRRLDRIYCQWCGKEYSTVLGPERVGEPQICHAFRRGHSLVAILEDGFYKGPPSVLG